VSSAPAVAGYPRKHRRWWVRVLLWTLALAVGLPLAYVLAGFGLALIPVNRDFRDAAAAEGVEVFLVSNGIHVDFLVPVTTPIKDWSRDLPRGDFPGAGEAHTRLLFGWGDRGFYLETPTWADLKVSTVLSAIFTPSASVVHAEYADWVPRPGPSSRRLVLDLAAYRKLCSYIERSFHRDGRGALVLLSGRGYGPEDNFYEAEGSYHAFNTCNLWTNRGLHEIGVRTALWSPFAPGVLWHLPQE
jgi:uncharacterized protein (TIGR02117 family)